MTGCRKAVRCQPQTVYLLVPENCLLCRQAGIVRCGYKCHEPEQREAEGRPRGCRSSAGSTEPSPQQVVVSDSTGKAAAPPGKGNSCCGLIDFVVEKKGGGAAHICKAVLLCACGG